MDAITKAKEVAAKGPWGSDTAQAVGTRTGYDTLRAGFLAAMEELKAVREELYQTKKQLKYANEQCAEGDAFIRMVQEYGCEPKYHEELWYAAEHLEDCVVMGGSLRELLSEYEKWRLLPDDERPTFRNECNAYFERDGVIPDATAMYAKLEARDGH